MVGWWILFSTTKDHFTLFLSKLATTGSKRGVVVFEEPQIQHQSFASVGQSKVLEGRRVALKLHISQGKSSDTCITHFRFWGIFSCIQCDNFLGLRKHTCVWQIYRRLVAAHTAHTVPLVILSIIPAHILPSLSTVQILGEAYGTICGGDQTCINLDEWDSSKECI